MQTTCSCQCGETEVLVAGSALMRFICHCNICQQVYQKPFADIVVVKSSQVVKPLNPVIEFEKHRSPPAVNRGVCASCHNPVVALMPLAPFFGLAFIPTSNFPEGVELPKPFLHSFYDRRVNDVEDELPKHAGYWSSQWAVTSCVLSSLLGLSKAQA